MGFLGYIRPKSGHFAYHYVDGVAAEGGPGFHNPSESAVVCRRGLPYIESESRRDSGMASAYFADSLGRARRSPQVLSIWLQGYVLGTLLNYMVEKDPVAEAHKARMLQLNRFVEAKQAGRPAQLTHSWHVLIYYDY